MRIDYKNGFDPRLETPRRRGPIRTIAAGLTLLTAVSVVSLALSGFALNASEPAQETVTQASPPTAAPGATSDWQPLQLPTPAGSKPASGAPAPLPVARPEPVTEPPRPVEPPKSGTIAGAMPAPPADLIEPAIDTFAGEPAVADQPVATTTAAAEAAAPVIELPDELPTGALDEIQAETHAEAPTVVLTVTEHRIRSGDSLAAIFKQRGLAPGVLHQIVTSGDDAGALARIRPGQLLRFHQDDNAELQRLELQRNPISTLRADLGDDGWQVEEVRKDVEKRQASASGTIQSSLFADGQKAGLADAQIMELAAIFGWDIDFALELRAGDRFQLIYEEQYLDGEKFRNGPILAAEFVNRGTTYRAIRYEDKDGNVSYYDADGRNKRRAFIRTPVKFARISSRFTNKRWHPVLKRNRAHKGVDYAAPTGTPIKATGAGKVIFRGTKGGYGRTVIIRHGGKYTTLYAHMSKFARSAKVGAKVKQGQVIGYVGRTGLASGPHLHYEFRVNGVHRNPLRVKLPKASPLPKAQMTSYLAHAAPLLEQLDALSSTTLVADAAAQ